MGKGSSTRDTILMSLFFRQCDTDTRIYEHLEKQSQLGIDIDIRYRNVSYDEDNKNKGKQKHPSINGAINLTSQNIQ